MLVKILGAIDLIAGILLVINISSTLPFQIMFLGGIILIGKSLLGFLKDFASWVDLTSGIVFLISTFLSLPVFLIAIVVILLIQKGVFSFL